MVPFPLAAGPSTAITGPFILASANPYPRPRRAALTGACAYGKARRRTRSKGRDKRLSTGGEPKMVKPEWGAKRTCPKCSTRVYDLGREKPVDCINCGAERIPAPGRKSKQPAACEPAPRAPQEA